MSTVSSDSPAGEHVPDVILPPLGAEGNDKATLWEMIRIALDSLRANKLRSLLTMLGITIGVASVVALLAIGSGASTQIIGSIQSAGANLLTVLPGSPTARGSGGAAPVQTLTLDDSTAIAELALPLVGVAPQYSASSQISAPAAAQNALVIGTLPDFQKINNFTLASGTFFNDSQVRAASPVIILGANVARELFGNGPAVGQTVRINNQILTVIGVLAARGGAAFGGSIDDRAIVPITVAYQRLFGGRTPDSSGYLVSAIQLAVTDPAYLDAVQSRVTLLLRERHQLPTDGSADDFRFSNQADLLSTLTTVTKVLTIFLAIVGGISLIVGGIGVMNIMLVSVTERTREIGLRKAVGARRQDRLLQVLVEALVLCLIGGIIGIILAGAIALAVTLSGVFAAPITISTVIIALSFSLLIGLFFGIYPARRAAQLNPIDALQSE
jgi:putative ABC transport system permease protein